MAFGRFVPVIPNQDFNAGAVLWPMGIISPDVRSWITQEDQERLRRFKTAWDAYHGTYPAPLPVKPNSSNDNVITNFSKVIIDKGVSFLFGDKIEFELAERYTDQQQETLDQIWRYNKKMTTLHKLAINGGICGQVFLKLNPPDPQNNQPYPRVIVLDPANVKVIWEDDDIDRVREYRIQYMTVDHDNQDKIVYKRQQFINQIVNWLIIDSESTDKDPRWYETNQSVWPYTWAPIHDSQNLPMPNEYWGLADLEPDIIELNNALNFARSNNQRIIRFHAHPKIWGKGFDDKELSVAIDQIPVFSDETASLNILEMQSDLTGSMNHVRQLEEKIHEMSRIPEVSTGKLDSIGNISGIALQILYQPLIEKTQTKRLLYGDLLQTLNSHMLELMQEEADIENEVKWQSLLPSDPKQEAEVAQIYDALGVSKHTIYTGIGIDYDKEIKLLEEENKDNANLGEQIINTFNQGALNDPNNPYNQGTQPNPSPSTANQDQGQ